MKAAQPGLSFSDHFGVSVQLKLAEPGSRQGELPSPCSILHFLQSRSGCIAVDLQNEREVPIKKNVMGQSRKPEGPRWSSRSK